MSDEPVKDCEKCGEPVKRLLFPVAIQFKGNGFYTTDYARKNGKGAVGAQSSGGGDSESSKPASASTDTAAKADSGAKSDSASKSD
jgi:predicted nucleic acid-binding Zn ribbon protein